MDYYKGITYYLELSLTDSKGNFVTGQTVFYNIYKSSDDTLKKSGTLAEIGITGIYKDSVVFSETDQYRVEYITPSKYDNAIETIQVEEFSASSTHLLNQKILGLCQSNYRVFNPVSDRSNQLLSGKIKTYHSAADVDSDTNPLAEYEISATYGIGKYRNIVTGYKVKEVE